MRREPFDVLRELETFANRVKKEFKEFDQARKSHGSTAGGSGDSRWPAVDVSYDDGAVYVEVDLPGMRKDQVTVSMRAEEAVEISGRRDATSEPGRERATSERFLGDFRRVIPIPPFVEVALDQVSATMEEGILKIRLPRRDAAEKRTIEII
jgi:HSP20 family protein